MQSWLVNLTEAQKLAIALMGQHQLTGWSFKFDHARRRFGACREKQKLITLSRPLTLLNSESQVRDTILHEIAHALVPRDGHGEKWKAMCRQIGAKPERCYTDTEVVSPSRRPARYRIGCTHCGWWTDRRRLTARKLLCVKCRQAIIYRDTVTGRDFRIEVVNRRRMIQFLSGMAS